VENERGAFCLERPANEAHGPLEPRLERGVSGQRALNLEEGFELRASLPGLIYQIPQDETEDKRGRQRDKAVHGSGPQARPLDDRQHLESLEEARQEADEARGLGATAKGRPPSGKEIEVPEGQGRGAVSDSRRERDRGHQGERARDHAWSARYAAKKTTVAT